ncbi:MAG: hypothetical protein DRJ64_02900 [Thermoprotei archaeon]|nr:MAG: hypothetical protein DRJ64_02900 [Thermoprotei archaeon]
MASSYLSRGSVISGFIDRYYTVVIVKTNRGTYEAVNCDKNSVVARAKSYASIKEMVGEKYGKKV